MSFVVLVIVEIVLRILVMVLLVLMVVWVLLLMVVVVVMLVMVDTVVWVLEGERFVEGAGVTFAMAGVVSMMSHWADPVHGSPVSYCVVLSSSAALASAFFLFSSLRSFPLSF